MSKSFCVISAVVHFLRIKFAFFFYEAFQYHSLSIFDKLSAFGCEFHLEMMVCVAFVVSLMECAISGVWMCMLNCLLNEFHAQYIRANCQHVYVNNFIHLYMNFHMLLFQSLWKFYVFIYSFTLVPHSPMF